MMMMLMLMMLMLMMMMSKQGAMIHASRVLQHHLEEQSPVMCAACCMNAESAGPSMHASSATPACCAAKMQFITGMYCSGVSAPASKLSMRGFAL
jgi:hypothetical protein